MHLSTGSSLFSFDKLNYCRITENNAKHYIDIKPIIRFPPFSSKAMIFWVANQPTNTENLPLKQNDNLANTNNSLSTKQPLNTVEQ